MKILFLDEVHPILESELLKHHHTIIKGYNESKDFCNEAVEDAFGIVIRSRFPMDKTFLSRAKNLRFIARSGAGMENIDIAYCEKNKIICFNSPEGNRNAVGEHALGMLLSLLNKLHTADRDVRNGIWDREKNRGFELDGKTIGLIGFGNNGKAFAKKLRGFDVKILAYDKYKTGFGDNQVHEARLEAIFENADIVSFHIPQNEETMFMANDSFFNSFLKPIYLLNLSRGKIVETSALVNCLKSGQVLGAGLDVLEYEKSSFESFFETKLPEPFRYLLQSDQVILSPHVGGWTEESYFKLSKVLAEKILGTDFTGISY